jgi:hypothetical protein
MPQKVPELPFSGVHQFYKPQQIDIPGANNVSCTGGGLIG